MLEVKLLGQFDARMDGVPLAIPSRAAQSLLAYLLLTAGTAHRREKLAGLFWPNTLEESARHNLRHELWRVRKAIDAGQPGDHEEACLLADEFSIAFNANAKYWLDVAVLELTRAEGASASDLMRTLSLYRGELLPGFYDEWVVLERERLHAIFEQIMTRLIECLVEEQRWKEILEWGERWIALGQTPEPAYRALMIAHSAMGNNSKVASAYQRCVESLRKDLGVEPSEQTRTLFERLRVGAKEVPSPLHPRSAAPPPDESPAPGEPPFKGLQYFNEGDADLFFGREFLTANLAAHLPQDRFLAIVGASGSGKSSIVRAGLVPALKRNNTRWQYHVITPTAHPLEALAATLARDVESIAATPALCDDLARDPRSLRLAIKRALQRGGALHLMLVVDQFEELFTLCRDEFEREAFIDNLLIAIAPETDAPVSVVVTLRADFYGHCAQYPDLREALAKHQEYIGPMSAEELRRATEEPARRGGWEFEQGLVDLILRDVGDEPGALPLLSHALLETWKRRRGRTLTLKGYAESDGVRGAIAKTAETVFHQLTLDQQRIARGIFLRLTELGEGTQDTRRRAAISELIPRPEDTAAVQFVLHTLADARLITTGEGTAEVAHEALIREWYTLRDWLNENREGLRLHRHLTESAQAWQKLNREPGELYRGVRLAQALEWAKTNVGEMNPLEREFLDASKELAALEEAEREAQRQRELIAAQKLAEAERRRAMILRWVAIGSSLLLVVMIGLALFAFSQRTEAVAQRDIAENERRIAFARELSVNSVSNLGVDPERSILLALQAISVSSTGGKPVLLEAEEALHRAVQTSRLQFILRGHAAGLYRIAYRPDGKRLATASIDKSAKVWDPTTGKELLTLCCHAQDVWGIAYSPDGTRIATSSYDKTAKVWDAVTGKELLTLCCHNMEVTGVAFSPDGTRIATSSLDKTAKVWDAATGKELFTMTGHNGGVGGIVYTLDGKRLATSSWNDEPESSARIWDAENGKLLLTLTGHTSSLWDITSSPDGKRVATGGADGTARIWDSTSGQLLKTIFSPGVNIRVVFSPDGKQLATGATDVRIWDAATGELLQTLAGHTGEVWGASFSPDGIHLATGSRDGTARVWDISPEGSRDWVTFAPSAGSPLAYSADGTRLAITSSGTAKILDALTGKELLTFSGGHTQSIKSVAFSPDGSRLATSSTDQTVKVWDLATGKQLLSLSTPTFAFPAGLRVAFSPDGQRIAAASSENSARVWDVATGKELLALRGHTQPVVGATYSPDGSRIATPCLDGTAKVWDAATGKELLTLSGHKAGLWVVSFSPDGKRIATASQDGTAKVWDAATGQLLLTLSGHLGNVFDAVFSPDSTRLATASMDGTIKLWDVSTGSSRSEQPLTFFNPSGYYFIAVAFAPDGKRLAAGGDGTIRIYALPLEDIITIAKSRVTRTLTTDECRKFLHVDKCP